jgi:sugar lactone lactonase YvrE
MSSSGRLKLTLIASLAAIALCGDRAYTQTDVIDPAKNNLPNPNPTMLKGWGPLPGGRVWGNTAGVAIGPDGNVWAYDRCGSNACVGSKAAPIVKFDRSSGKLLKSFGAGMFIFPHGIHVDRDGNVWITDGRTATAEELAKFPDAKGKGHTVIKFSPDGKVLMTLGTPGVPGNPPSALNEPNAVITAPNGDIFVGDGHSGQQPDAPPGTVARIVKFDRNGKFIKTWGRLGSAPGEFRTPHALAFDSRGRLFVADRGNHRIQIFDQDGTYLDSFKQFSRVSGIYIRNDTLYAIDSETNQTRHPGWKTGIRIGSTKEDKVFAFIPPHPTDKYAGAAGEGIAVDPDGNVYAAEGPGSRPFAGGGLTKYVKRGSSSSR